MNWPQNSNDYQLTYNVMMLLATIVPAFAIGPLWALLIGAAWSSFWFWDLFLRPWLYPESDAVPDEMTELDKQFQKWIESQQPQLMKELENVKMELSELKGKVVLREGESVSRRLFKRRGKK